MLLILEIVLTAVAWRKGWRTWALLPLGLGIFVAFFIGLVAGAAGLQADQMDALMLALTPIDLAVTGILIWMVVKGKKRELEMVESTISGQPANFQNVDVLREVSHESSKG
jgi:hypothetical protein